jgi:hypothetical protein
VDGVFWFGYFGNTVAVISVTSSSRGVKALQDRGSIQSLSIYPHFRSSDLIPSNFEADLFDTTPNNKYSAPLDSRADFSDLGLDCL